MLKKQNKKLNNQEVIKINKKRECNNNHTHPKEQDIR